jgi:hypothetical protein
MTSKEFLDIVYKNMDDKDYGIIAPPTDPQLGLSILIRHFLGDDWYSMNPIHITQINTEAICEILDKYPNGQQKKDRRKASIKQWFIDLIETIFG